MVDFYTPLADALHCPGFYLSAEDALRLRVLNAVAGARVSLDGRIALPDGRIVPFAYDLAPTADRLVSTRIAQPGAGWLLGVGVRATAGAPRRGQTFVMVEVVRGFSGDVLPLGVLVQGYVTETSRRAWPGSPLEDSTDGRGCMRSITGTDPAAGVETIEIVPAGARWRLVTARFTLLTDATVAARQATFTVDDGATQLFNVSAHTTQAASQTFTYQLFPVGSNGYAVGTVLQVNGVPNVDLVAGWRIRTSTGLLQAGDNWAAPQLLVEEWIET